MTVERKMPSWNYSFPVNELEQVTQGLSFFIWKQTSEFLFKALFEVVNDVEKRADSRKENNICKSSAAIWDKAGVRGSADLQGGFAKLEEGSYLGLNPDLTSL